MGWQPPIPLFIRGEHGAHQSVEPLAGQRRDWDQGHPLDLRQETGAGLLELGEPPLRRALKIPFVHGDDERSPLLDDKVGNLEILLLEWSLGVEQEDHDLGELDGAKRVTNGQLLGLALNPHLAPQARRVEQPDRSAPPV